MYPLPDDGSPEPAKVLCHIPSSKPIKVIVRVYIIRVSVKMYRVNMSNI